MVGFFSNCGFIVFSSHGFGLRHSSYYLLAFSSTSHTVIGDFYFILWIRTYVFSVSSELERTDHLAHDEEVTMSSTMWPNKPAGAVRLTPRPFL